MLGEDGGDEGAYAAFAFGAGYVDYVETIEVFGLIDNVSKTNVSVLVGGGGKGVQFTV